MGDLHSTTQYNRKIEILPHFYVERIQKAQRLSGGLNYNFITW